MRREPELGQMRAGRRGGPWTVDKARKLPRLVDRAATPRHLEASVDIFPARGEGQLTPARRSPNPWPPARGADHALGKSAVFWHSCSSCAKCACHRLSAWLPSYAVMVPSQCRTTRDSGIQEQWSYRLGTESLAPFGLPGLRFIEVVFSPHPLPPGKSAVGVSFSFSLPLAVPCFRPLQKSLGSKQCKALQRIGPKSKPPSPPQPRDRHQLVRARRFGCANIIMAGTLCTFSHHRPLSGAFPREGLDRAASSSCSASSSGVQSVLVALTCPDRAVSCTHSSSAPRALLT